MNPINLSKVIICLHLEALGLIICFESIWPKRLTKTYVLNPSSIFHKQDILTRILIWIQRRKSWTWVPFFANKIFYPEFLIWIQRSHQKLKYPLGQLNQKLLTKSFTSHKSRILALTFTNTALIWLESDEIN